MLSNRAVRLIALAFTAVLAVNTLGALTVPVTSESAAEAIPAETNTEASEASTDFKDIKDKSKYYYEPVKWAAKYGITTGYKDGTFKPGNIVTRAQMVTFLWRLCGSPEPSIQKSKFKDIKSSDYWYKPAIWGNENHIVEGYKDGTFRPQTACTRAQAVTFMYRMSDQRDHLEGTELFFLDLSGKEEEYYYRPAYWGMRASIVAGIATDRGNMFKNFNPKGKVTRGQMVTFLYKLSKYSTKTHGTGAMKQNVMHTNGKIPNYFGPNADPTISPIVHSCKTLATVDGVKVLKASSKDQYGNIFYDLQERDSLNEEKRVYYTLYVSKKVKESDFYIKYKKDEGFRDIDNCRFVQYIPHRVEPDIISEVEYKDKLTGTSTKHSNERAQYMAGKGYTKAVTFKIVCGIYGDVGIDLYYKGTKLETITFNCIVDCKVYDDMGSAKEIWDDISKYEGIETDFDIISAAEYWIRNHSYEDGYTCNSSDLVAALMSMKGHPAWTMYCAEKTDAGVKNDYYHYHTKCPRTQDKGDVYRGH
ncbi:MAG: S-layer homology domain-containing protein, partial [Lachnospiraceae bacterium]|nr:S-layer homology domain-containing protein [Lachnospiraceae bacterium]